MHVILDFIVLNTELGSHLIEVVFHLILDHLIDCDIATGLAPVDTLIICLSEGLCVQPTLGEDGLDSLALNPGE